MVLILVMDKMIGAAYLKCESRIKLNERDPRTEREGFEELVRLTETELFEKCKEIFHIRYKTRKGWNERFNPIRDGSDAWKVDPIDEKTARLVADLRRIMYEFGTSSLLAPFVSGLHSLTGLAGQEITAASLPSTSRNTLYTNAGRLASIFLVDFSNML